MLQLWRADSGGTWMPGRVLVGEVVLASPQTELVSIKVGELFVTVGWGHIDLDGRMAHWYAPPATSASLHQG